MLHDTVDIVAPWDAIIPVDEAIAEMITKIWADGIHTFFSCQGYTPDDPRLPRIEKGCQRFMHGYVTVKAGFAERVIERHMSPAWVTKIETPKTLNYMHFETQTIRFLRFE